MRELPLAAVFFDAAGTLFALRESVGAGYASMAERFGFTLDPAAVEAEFHAQWKAFPPPSTGSPPRDDGKDWWQGLVFRLLDSMDCARLPPQLRQDYFDALYAHYADPGQWVAFPEVSTVLETLRRGHPDLVLGVISNFDARLRSILDGLGLSPFFQDVVISTEIGHSKPDGAIFEAACRRSGLSGPDCLHVGDDPREDWEGARGAGLRVLELRRPETDLTALLDLLP